METPPTRSERHLAMLQELAEIGMNLARAVGQEARAEAQPSPQQAQTFAKLSRAIRQTIALEHKIAHPRPPKAHGHHRIATARQNRIASLVREAAKADPDAPNLRTINRYLEENLDDSPDFENLDDTPEQDDCGDETEAGLLAHANDEEDPSEHHPTNRDHPSDEDAQADPRRSDWAPEHHPTNRDHPSDEDARQTKGARVQADPLRSDWAPEHHPTNRDHPSDQDARQTKGASVPILKSY